jgi:hypothetical protein
MPRRHRLRVHKSPLHRSKRSRRRARLDGGSGAARAFQPLESRLYLNAAPTANDQYISGLFADLLNRPATAADVSSFSSQLDSGIGSLIPGGLLGSLSSTLGSILGEGAAARVPVAWEIMNSAEFDTAAVQNAFSSLLGRQADPGALTAFAGFLSSGGSLAQLDALIAGSPEYFQTRGKGTTQGFLDALYHDALARAPDAAGLASFTTALASGYSDQAVANFIFGSSEFQSDWISGLYGHFADRAPTAAELQSSTLILHVAGEKVALAGILANGSSYGVLSDHANGLYVAEMYRDLLQRDPDTASLNAWENALDSGTLQGGDIAQDILTSPEYNGLVVQNIFNQYLGRTADPSGMAYFSDMLASGATPEDVAAYIAGSPEYLQQHTQGTTQSYLESFYQDTFGAPLSGAGPAFIASLNVQAGDQPLATEILSSTTYRGALVDGIYGQLLGRSATAADMALGEALLASAHGDAALMKSIIATSEYQRLDEGDAFAPGAFAMSLLSQTGTVAHNALLAAEGIGETPGTQVNVSSLVDSIEGIQQTVSSIQGLLKPLLLKQVDQVVLDSTVGQQVVVDRGALIQIDKVVTYMAEQAAQAPASGNLAPIESAAISAASISVPDISTPDKLWQWATGYTLDQTRHGLIDTVLNAGSQVSTAVRNAGNGLSARTTLFTAALAQLLDSGLKDILSGGRDHTVSQEVIQYLTGLDPQRLQQLLQDIRNNANQLGAIATKLITIIENILSQFNIASPNSVVSVAKSETIVYDENAPKQPVRDIGIGATPLRFETQSGGANPPSQQLVITNDSSDNMALDATATPDESNLVDISEQSTGSLAPGDASDETVSINAQGLEPGTYDDGIDVSDANTPDGTAYIPVVITVDPTRQIPPQVGGEFGGGQSPTPTTPGPAKNLGNFEGQFDAKVPVLPGSGVQVDEQGTITQVTLTLGADGTLSGENLKGSVDQFDINGNPAGTASVTGSLTATVSSTPDAQGFNVHGPLTLNVPPTDSVDGYQETVPFSATLASANQRLSGITVDANGQKLGSFALHSIQ